MFYSIFDETENPLRRAVWFNFKTPFLKLRGGVFCFELPKSLYNIPINFAFWTSSQYPKIKDYFREVSKTGITMSHAKEKLIELVDYVEHVTRLNERPVFNLEDYHQLLFYEVDLKNKVGIEHDQSDNAVENWLKIKRLKRIDPPDVPETIKDWISVGRDPSNKPIVEKVRTEIETEN